MLFVIFTYLEMVVNVLSLYKTPNKNLSVCLLTNLVPRAEKPWERGWLLTSSVILPAIAGEVFLLEVNAWVRLSISDACDPWSGFFAGIVFPLSLALFMRSTASTADSTSRVFPPARLFPPDMSSISSSSERRVRSSLKIGRATVWSSELSASCASEFKDLGEFWGEFPPCSHSDRSFVLCLKGLKWSLRDLQCLMSSSST